MGLGEELHGHVAVKLGIPRAVDDAHPSRTERGQNFIGPEARDCFERHSIPDNAERFYTMAGRPEFLVDSELERKH